MIQLVGRKQQHGLVQAVWQALGQEVQDLRDSVDQEWAQEGASHLYTAIELLLQHLLRTAGQDDEMEPREP